MHLFIILVPIVLLVLYILTNQFIKKTLFNSIQNPSFVENQKLLNEPLFSQNSIDTKIIFVVVAKIEINVDRKYEIIFILGK